MAVLASFVHGVFASTLMFLLLCQLAGCDSNPEDGVDRNEDDESLRKRTLLRRISIASERETEIRSQRKGVHGSPNREPGSTVSTDGIEYSQICNYCPAVSCGRRQLDFRVIENRRAKILDGIEADYGAYPWQVSIEKRGEITGRKWLHICGGALISKFHVLTAAHCFRDTLSEFRVIVGNHYLNKTDHSEQIFQLQPGDFTNHRRFGYQSEYDNDISFVRLRSKNDGGVQFDQYVHPICLPPEDGVELESGARCHISGWGVQDKKSTHKVSPTLRVAEVPLTSKRECQKAYRIDHDDNHRENYLRRYPPSSSPSRKTTLITDGNLCAGGNGPDACSGDSGGPLACSIPGQQNAVFLAGLVSWGKSCGSKTHPGVYTKVSYYLKWIYNEIELSKPDYELFH